MVAVDLTDATAIFCNFRYMIGNRRSDYLALISDREGGCLARIDDREGGCLSYVVATTKAVALASKSMDWPYLMRRLSHLWVWVQSHRCTQNSPPMISHPTHGLDNLGSDLIPIPPPHNGCDRGNHIIE